MSGEKLIISVKEARKILGKEAQKLTDEEIAKLIDDLDFLAKYAIRKFRSNSRTASQDETEVV